MRSARGGPRGPGRPFSRAVTVVCATFAARRRLRYPGGSQSCGVDVIRGHLWALVIARRADEMGPVMSGQQKASQGVTVVALLADPDAPTEIAQRMGQVLPRRLADRSGHGRRFDVEVISEPFSSGTEDPPTLMRRVIDR